MEHAKYTEREERALNLFAELDTEEVDIGSSDLDKYIPMDVARSLHKKGCITIAYKGPGEFKTVLTIWGKTLRDSKKETNLDNNERTEEMSTENEFKCVCGKQMKNKSGFTLHQKKCKIYLDSSEESNKESNEDKHEPDKNWSIEDDEKLREETKSSKEPKSSNLATPPVGNEVVEVEIGTMLVLSGSVWCRKPDETEYSNETVNDIKVKVEEKVPSGGNVWLMCNAEGSDLVWAVFEEEVISGKYKILSDDQSEDCDPEDNEDRDKFRKSLTKFVEARAKKLNAEKEFKKIEKVERSSIEEYTRKYGKESGEGKQDFQVFEDGYNVHIVRTPGKPTISYKEDAMASWLISNGHNDCIKHIPDINMWNNLKAAGKVPPEIISGFEDLGSTADSFALTIKEEK